MNQQIMILLTKEEIEIISASLDSHYLKECETYEDYFAHGLNNRLERLKKSIQDLQFKLSEL